MAERKTRYANASYISGNTVRKAAPERVERTRRNEETEEKRQISERTRRNQEKALSMSFPFVMFLAAASVAAVFICFQYLQINTSINQHLDSIEELESQITELKSDNKALETKINTYYNLDYVYTVATQELGMVYATADQVIEYNRTESEYVRQYDDIPEQ